VELILASGSPRRAEILRTLGLDARVERPEVEESVLPGEAPEAHAERLAREKALSVALRHPERWIVAGDTVVTDGRSILGKPQDQEDAVRTLLLLQGRTHRVISALALVSPDGRSIHSGVQITRVTFRPFDSDLAEAYVQTGEPMDKAGSYGIQGAGAALVDRIEGDYSGVVGLPVPLLVRLMEEAGRPFRFRAP